MAVLPTPGSPMSTGLFLVRRHRTRMHRLISSSRPMTGSSTATLAVRSMPYFCSACESAHKCQQSQYPAIDSTANHSSAKHAGAAKTAFSS